MAESEKIDNRYNLGINEKNVISQCIEENPELTLDDISVLLGISVRTLYRKIDDYQIYRKGDRKTIRAMSVIKKAGYKVSR
jgi:hypothetical protein